MADRLVNPEELSIEPSDVGLTQFDQAEEAAGRERVVRKLRLLWDRRRLLLRFAGVGLVLSVLLALASPNQYVSSAHLMPPDEANPGLSLLAAASRTGAALGGSLGSVAGDLLGTKSSGALFIGILQGRTVQDDLIDKFNLRKVYGARLMDDAREDLERNTNVSEDRKSGIISIQVTDKNPKRAAAMAQEYVDELTRVVTDLNTSSAHRERMFLEKRLAAVKQDLESAEKSFSEFASQNKALDIQAQGKATLEAGATLEGEMIAAETELQSLKQMYSDGNVRVRAMQARVDELRRQLEKLGGRFDNEASANGQQNDQELTPSIRRLPLLGVGYADLYRNTKVQEAIFETLTQGYELAKVQEVKETPSVVVIDPPNVPERKTSPHRTYFVLASILFSLLLGTGWILGNEHWMKIDRQDPRKVFALEIFHTMAARVPSIRARGNGANGLAENSLSDFPGRNGSTQENSDRGKLEQ
ncbi:MAG: lipopolysaccharide biosynthesis protein [Candidatus Acidiferrales bacterium]|jgi:uncharacterized protein involved in exopolysaccharide biosynthesis